MKLNLDLIRDILLAVEETTTFKEWFYYPQQSKNLDKYDVGEVLYHMRQCELLGFFTFAKYSDMSDIGGYDDDEYKIQDLSPAGHEFLATVRSDDVWNNAKSLTGKFGVQSLSTIKAMAERFCSPKF